MTAYRSILLAIDLEPDSNALIDYAFAFAEKVHATLHMLHAAPQPAGRGQEVDASQRARAKDQLESALRHHRASSALGRCFFDAHEPVVAILRAAELVAADLIILGTHARRGRGRILLGSVVHGVMDEASAPVLVLRAPRDARLPT